PPSEVAHPVGHDHALDLDAVIALVDLRLTVERQAVVILRDRYMGDEVGTRPSLEDWQIGCRCLHDGLARAAGVDRTDISDNLELRRDLLQDFGYLFADFGAAGGVVAVTGELGFEDDDFAREMIGERLAHCRPARPPLGWLLALTLGLSLLGTFGLGLCLLNLGIFEGELELIDRGVELLG